MKFVAPCLAVLSLSLCALSAQARDDVLDYSVAEALATEQAKAALGSDIRFAFGSQSLGTVTKRYGEFGTNRKTNGVGKSDRSACERVFLSALLVLKQRAVREGGNAVINIRSNYRGNLTSSNDTFKCGSGAIMSGVALVGDVVTVK